LSIAIENIQAAAEFLKGRIRRTPVEYSDPLSKILGAPTWLKLESMQLTGSFKIRGALYRLSKLSDAERRDGVVTCSAGNHGKGVAYAAREQKVCATVCVPRSIDWSKLAGMVAWGADVRISEFDGYDQAETWAQEVACAEGRTFLSAFDDFDVMAANGGTVAMEVLEDAPDARRFVLPVGGGGLGAGFAFWTRHRLPGATIIGCQHQLSPSLVKSIEAGRAITKLPAVETMAGGVEGGIGALTFPILAPLLASVALVSEDEILEGVRWMLAKHQYLIEPTAAVPLAACLNGCIAPSAQPTVVVISGRNVSAESVKKILCGPDPHL
jgi:threonine dehydratase